MFYTFTNLLLCTAYSEAWRANTQKSRADACSIQTSSRKSPSRYVRSNYWSKVKGSTWKSFTSRKMILETGTRRVCLRTKFQGAVGTAKDIRWRGRHCHNTSRGKITALRMKSRRPRGYLNACTSSPQFWLPRKGPLARSNLQGTD